MKNFSHRLHRPVELFLTLQSPVLLSSELDKLFRKYLMKNTINRIDFIRYMLIIYLHQYVQSFRIYQL